MKKIAMALLAALMFIPVMHADTLTSTTLDNVAFTVTFTSVTGATETLTGSFEYEMEPGFEFMLPGTAQVSSNGFLGTFSDPVMAGASFLAFLGTFGDEIDLFINGDQSDPGGLAIGFLLFGCVSVECDDAYPTDASFNGKEPTSETFTISRMPEPGTWLLLMIGIVALVGIQRRFNERCATR